MVKPPGCYRWSSRGRAKQMLKSAYFYGTTRSYSSKCREGSICIRGRLRYQKGLWVPGLLYKLHKAGMSGKIWRLIKESYQGFQCAAFIAGEVGEWFDNERGVHQGAPLSMKLYTIYINDLHQDLRASIYGVYTWDRCDMPKFCLRHYNNDPV